MREDDSEIKETSDMVSLWRVGEDQRGTQSRTVTLGEAGVNQAGPQGWHTSGTFSRTQGWPCPHSRILDLSAY